MLTRREFCEAMCEIAAYSALPKKEITNLPSPDNLKTVNSKIEKGWFCLNGVPTLIKSTHYPITSRDFDGKPILPLNPDGSFNYSNLWIIAAEMKSRGINTMANWWADERLAYILNCFNMHVIGDAKISLNYPHKIGMNIDEPRGGMDDTLAETLAKNQTQVPGFTCQYIPDVFTLNRNLAHYAGWNDKLEARIMTINMNTPLIDQTQRNYWPLFRGIRLAVEQKRLGQTIEGWGVVLPAMSDNTISASWMIDQVTKAITNGASYIGFYDHPIGCEVDGCGGEARVNGLKNGYWVNGGAVYQALGLLDMVLPDYSAPIPRPLIEGETYAARVFNTAIPQGPFDTQKVLFAYGIDKEVAIIPGLNPDTPYQDLITGQILTTSPNGTITVELAGSRILKPLSVLGLVKQRFSN